MRIESGRMQEGISMTSQLIVLALKVKHFFVGRQTWGTMNHC